jgi:hypothetical protein
MKIVAILPALQKRKLAIEKQKRSVGAVVAAAVAEPFVTASSSKEQMTLEGPQQRRQKRQIVRAQTAHTKQIQS